MELVALPRCRQDHVPCRIERERSRTSPLPPSCAPLRALGAPPRPIPAFHVKRASRIAPGPRVPRISVHNAAQPCTRPLPGWFFSICPRRHLERDPFARPGGGGAEAPPSVAQLRPPNRCSVGLPPPPTSAPSAPSSSPLLTPPAPLPRPRSDPGASRPVSRETPPPSAPAIWLRRRRRFGIDSPPHRAQYCHEPTGDRAVQEAELLAKQ
jgi:hypothetical protein